MASVKLKDATKELVEEASGILEEATRIRKEADSLFDTLKRMDAEMNRQAQERLALEAALRDALEAKALRRLQLQLKMKKEYRDLKD